MMHTTRLAFVFALAFALAGPSAFAQEVDLVLENGTIYDGSGGPPVVGHVAVKGDRIVSVGTEPVDDAKWRIDVTGLIVTPGFIDLHTHSDEEIVAPKTRSAVNYLMQGCTTSITGNCGMGPIDVENYYRQIDAAGAGTNVGHLLPQGTLRAEVVGHGNRPASPEELDEMRRLVRQAMRDGAWGMSTGLIYTPSTYAGTDELIELAKVVAAGNGIYVSHIRGEESGLLGSIQEAIHIGREAGLPTHVSHLKVKGTPNWGTLKLAIEQIEQARAAGQTVTADQYPYIAASTSLEATIFPAWSRSGGSKKLVERLDDPEAGKRIRKDVSDSLAIKEDGAQIVVAVFRPRPDWIGKNLREIATAEQKTPLEIAEFIIRNGGAAIVNFAMNEEDVRLAMTYPWVATASDGFAALPNADRPHPRSYGTFPRKIGHYSLRENVLPLPQAIRSATGLPAEILGMKDRGYLKPGLIADVTVFDPETIIDNATFTEPHQYATGIQYVLVNGVPAVFRGQPTGALAGKALRKNEHDP